MGSRRGRERTRVLIADDQKDVREALRLLLKGEGLAAELVGSPGAVLEALERHSYDLVLMDLNYTRDTTSGREGMDLLRRLREHDPALPVVVMTAWGTIDLAVEAMRHGARDFIEKPWENARLISVLRTQLELASALRHQDRLRAENALLRGGDDEAFIGESPAMREVVKLVERVAPADANILITGENGTGKSLIAQIVHRLSARSDASLITVNMGGVAASVFESEMFGHEKGAFTDARETRIGRFEMADGGTLFMDEIANVPLEQQGKLLRVLESGEFERLGSSRTRRADVRVIAATNADLQAMVDAGEFRKDLYFRLNTVELCLPPLRERPEDVSALALRFLAQHASRYQRAASTLSEEALLALRRYPWPGNVRELNHVMERAVLLAEGERIEVADLNLSDAGGAPVDSAAALAGMTLEDAERIMIRNALDRHGGNVNQAAESLGLSRSALYRRIDKYGL